MKSDGATALGYFLSITFYSVSDFEPLSGDREVGRFFDPPSMEIVLGGTFATVFVNFTFDEAKKMPTIIKQGFQILDIDNVAIIKVLISFAKKARREGLLSLEEDVEQVDNPFVKKGIQLVIDGTEGDLVRYILEAEVEQLNARHEGGKDDFLHVYLRACFWNDRYPSWFGKHACSIG